MNINLKAVLLFSLVLLAIAQANQKQEIDKLFRISKLLGQDHLDLQTLYNEAVSKPGVLSMSEYEQKRKELIEQDRSTHFTVDVPSLTKDEQKVEEILVKMRDQVIQGDHSPFLLDFYEGQKLIKDGELHNFFKPMPKGGHMHIHIEASVAMETFMNFTYADFVYYNVDKNELLTAPNGTVPAGFDSCNSLRKNWKLEGTFDEYLVEKLLLGAQEIASKESHKIWDGFQFKFALNDAVIHYHKFYREALLAYYRQAVSEGVSIIEIRHASGILFDDNHQFLNFTQEFDLYQSVINEIKAEDPDFEIRVIVVAFKVLGHEAVRFQMESYKFALVSGYNFVTGFDLVNEEDFTPSIHEFVPEMLEFKQNHPNFNFYFHSGESTSRFNENLYDAVLMDTKRIGHGIGLVFHPHLIDLVRDRKIGYEICPISNFILGYTLDMRWHPARQLMAEGVEITISSDDPTFWAYQGISLDFTYAFLAWQLDLKDVKQLAINSIKHSSIEDSLKPKYLDKFERDWKNYMSAFLAAHSSGAMQY